MSSRNVALISIKNPPLFQILQSPNFPSFYIYSFELNNVSKRRKQSKQTLIARRTDIFRIIQKRKKKHNSQFFWAEIYIKIYRFLWKKLKIRVKQMMTQMQFAWLIFNRWHPVVSLNELHGCIAIALHVEQKQYGLFLCMRVYTYTCSRFAARRWHDRISIWLSISVTCSPLLTGTVSPS